jgi:hypothetical protein
MKLAVVEIYWLYVDFFVITRILLCLSLLSFVNIIVDNYPSFGLHMKMRKFFIACQFGVQYW